MNCLTIPVIAGCEKQALDSPAQLRSWV